MILRRRGYTFGVKVWLAIFGLVLCGQTLPVQKERALGEAILLQSRRFLNTEVEAYVERVGARLGSGFQIVVTAGDGGEPVGLPGQIIMVPARFLLAVEDEAEFAGMLAHAMGHSALRHGFVELRDGGVPLVYMGGWMGAHADSSDGAALYPAAVKARIAELELEADRYGAEAAARAGFDGAGLTRYLARRPSAEKRLAALADVGAEGGEVSSSELLRVREIVRAALAAPVRKAPSLRRIR